MLNFFHQQKISLLQNQKVKKTYLWGIDKLFNFLLKKLSPTFFFGHEFLHHGNNKRWHANYPKGFKLSNLLQNPRNQCF